MMMEVSSTTTTSSRAFPFREDCWSEEATSTLVDAWGRRYLELNRGNLRQKDWQEVADAVNALHGHTNKTRRTDVQCKNRIDTLKKKYKIEKAKIVDSNGTLTSSWPFFVRLDALIGSNYNNKQQQILQPFKLTPLSSSSPSPASFALNSPPMAVPLPYRKPPPLYLPPPQPQAVVLPQKRPGPALDDSYLRRNYSAVAAAAAAAKPVVGGEEEEKEDMESEEAASDQEEEEEGVRRLAKAIERFGEIYERVERMKQRQMVELEKQRMQFTKDLEVQRMHLFMDTQIHLEKMKHAKRSGLEVREETVKCLVRLVHSS